MYTFSRCIHSLDVYILDTFSTTEWDIQHSQCLGMANKSITRKYICQDKYGNSISKGVNNKIFGILLIINR